MTLTRARLGVNIDHVATIRNARGGTHPDPAKAAAVAHAAGADGITIHLREDRRHIRDADLAAVRAATSLPINLEMATTDEMLAIALDFKPHAACLVPERREERTTEGGLDVARLHDQVAPFVTRSCAMPAAASRCSSSRASSRSPPPKRMGAPVVELHTGKYVELVFAGDKAGAEEELKRLQRRRCLRPRNAASKSTSATGSPTTPSIPSPPSRKCASSTSATSSWARRCSSASTPPSGACASEIDVSPGVSHDHRHRSSTCATSAGSRKSLAEFGDRFTQRVFTEVERQARPTAAAQRAPTYAKRFAAKEACAKALGTGVPRRGVHWQHMGVINLPTGKPTFALTGGAAERLAKLTPPGMTCFVHLTITDEYPYAQAQVIIEALPTVQTAATGVTRPNSSHTGKAPQEPLPRRGAAQRCQPEHQRRDARPTHRLSPSRTRQLLDRAMTHRSAAQGHDRRMEQ